MAYDLSKPTALNGGLALLLMAAPVLVTVVVGLAALFGAAALLAAPVWAATAIELGIGTAAIGGLAAVFNYDRSSNIEDKAANGAELNNSEKKHMAKRAAKLARREAVAEVKQEAKAMNVAQGNLRSEAEINRIEQKSTRAVEKIHNSLRPGARFERHEGVEDVSQFMHPHQEHAVAQAPSHAAHAPAHPVHIATSHM